MGNELKGVSATFHKLTPKQQKFIEEYLMSFNVVQSYIKAGYSTNGKPATVNKNAYQLLHSETIQQALSELIEEVQDNKEYLSVKLEKFFLKTIDDETASMKDRLKSAEMLAKILGLFENKVNLKTNSDFEFNFNISTPEGTEGE